MNHLRKVALVAVAALAIAIGAFAFTAHASTPASADTNQACTQWVQVQIGPRSYESICTAVEVTYYQSSYVQPFYIQNGYGNYNCWTNQLGGMQCGQQASWNWNGNCWNIGNNCYNNVNNQYVYPNGYWNPGLGGYFSLAGCPSGQRWDTYTQSCRFNWAF